MHVSPAQPVNVSEVLLHTGCPDCVVVYSTYTIGESTYTGVQLLSESSCKQSDLINAGECIHSYSQKISFDALGEMDFHLRGHIQRKSEYKGVTGKFS